MGALKSTRCHAGHNWNKFGRLRKDGGRTCTACELARKQKSRAAQALLKKSSATKK